MNQHFENQAAPLALPLAISTLDRFVQEQGTAAQREAWTVVTGGLERARLAAEDRPGQEAALYDRGLEAARDGVHELAAGFDDLPFSNCPEAWAEKPFARICWYEDGGDPGVGIPARHGWNLAADQAGTVLQELAAAARGAAPSGVYALWTRTGGPVFLGGVTQLQQPFARITRFQSRFGAQREGWALAADQAGTMIEPLLAVASVDVDPPPAAESLLEESSTPGWVVRALRSALDRDPAQAAAEATVLARVLVARREAVASACAQLVPTGKVLGISA
ncbi:MAG: hypothetical protein HYX47_12045 [Burkholderiales bacterium]|nr:hypothetical protein [Burkholderiales bacterium]